MVVSRLHFPRGFISLVTRLRLRHIYTEDDFERMGWDLDPGYPCSATLRDLEYFFHACPLTSNLRNQDPVSMPASLGVSPIAVQSRFPLRIWYSTLDRGLRGRWPDISDAATVCCNLLTACFLPAWPLFFSSLMVGQRRFS